MSLPKNHHYVPQCYLNEFREEKKLICLDLSLVLIGLNVNLSYKAPKQVCYIENYYKIINENYFNLNDYEENYIELKAFSKLENEYRKVIRKIFESGELDIIDGKILSDFILNLKIRNPSYNKVIEHHKERNTEIAKNLLIEELINDYRYSAIPFSILKKQVDSFGERILKSSNFNKSLQFKQIIDNTDNNSTSIEKFRKEILDCKWYLLDSKNCEFSIVTSDNPGISVTDDGTLENMKFKGGFKFYFPLNSRYCLYFSDKEKDDFYSSNKKFSKKIYLKNLFNEELNLINFQQICYHNKFAFSTEESSLFSIKEQLLRK